MRLLDTDHISLLDRGGVAGEKVRQRLATIPAGEIATTIISYEEQMRGWLAYVNSLRRVDAQLEAYGQIGRMLEFYCVTPLLSFDQAALDHFQQLWVQRLRIGTMDLKIASIALAHGATIVTRNVRDFGRIAGLPVEDWTT